MSVSTSLVVFFVVNAIIVAIVLGSSKPSGEGFDSFSYLPPLVFEAECQVETSKDENYYNDDNDDFLSRSVCIEHEMEKSCLLEYFNEDSDGFHGYDGCEGESDVGDGSDDDINSEDEQDEDLKGRIEEFIAKNNNKWREELLSDKLLWIVIA
ncbi:hypothetical protein U1Q18_023433 [Sarracenia purpurea var. burkii]